MCYITGQLSSNHLTSVFKPHSFEQITRTKKATKETKQEMVAEVDQKNLTLDQTLLLICGFVSEAVPYAISPVEDRSPGSDDRRDTGISSSKSCRCLNGPCHASYYSATNHNFRTGQPGPGLTANSKAQ
jgi:hypothetical protein